MEKILKKTASAEKYRRIIIVVCTVGLTGLIFISPFANDFRITLSVAVLAMFLLILKNLPCTLTALLSGSAVVVLRTCWSFWSAPDSFELFQELPALIFYLSYGAGFALINIRQTASESSLALLFHLILLDIFSNCAELFLRGGVNDLSWLPLLMFAAVVRTFFIILGYQLLLNYQRNILRQNHWERYCELLILSAKLRAEWFYLQKSSGDIEMVMEKSYLLYQNLIKAAQTPEEKLRASEALFIAREIHEVKKDYLRVTRGLEEILKIPPHGGTMLLSEIFLLVEQNTRRYLQQGGKKIHVTFKLCKDVVTDRYYTLTAILDNMLINSIEACKDDDEIIVRQFISDTHLTLEIQDSGPGIAPHTRDYIFEPGYSTKYSPVTGKMSTGIGLSHVKNLVNNLSGEVELIYSAPGHTMFRVIVPIQSLLVEHTAPNSLADMTD